MKTHAPISLIILTALLAAPLAGAAEFLRPFIATSQTGKDFEQVVSATRERLTAANFDLAGEYRPYDGAAIIVVSNDRLREAAIKSERGAYGAAIRVAVSRVGDEIQVSYNNPVYWANAYRMADDLQAVGHDLAAALGNGQAFGSGDRQLSADDLREYHYTFMMEYFDDPSYLNTFSSHAEAVSAVEAGLAAGAGGTGKVYRIDLGKDPEGRQMTLFGVSLAGGEQQDCSGDEYIMSRIDRSSPRHTAHLPYEMLVYGNRVEALYARFRIAISWPHLPMIASDTGATFFSIMCAPSAIEEALTLAAGGKVRDPFENKK